MIDMIGKIKAAMQRALQARAHEEARRQLAFMSDRNLADIGVSRDLLDLGVRAWPWKIAEDNGDEKVAKAAASAVRNQAIRELSAYSDRQLKDIGLTRDGIVDAVNNTRPALAAVFDRNAA